MRVNVQLLGHIVRYSPTGRETFLLEVELGATLAGLLAAIGFPAEEEKVVLVNGRQAKDSAVLAEGDEVFIFVPAAGG
jgi:molybdopterin converting factor small subunit